MSFSCHINHAMIQHHQNQTLNHKITAFAQSSQRLSQQFDLLDLLQSIHTFVNEQCKKDQQTYFTIKILDTINNQLLFRSLFLFFIQKLSTRGQANLESEMLAFVFKMMDEYDVNDANVNFKARLMIGQLLMEKCNVLEKIMERCRDSQQNSEKVLKIINNDLSKRMSHQPIVNANFTPTILHSLMIIQHFESISNSLIQQSLRHILIVDSIQKGHVQKIIFESDTLIHKLGLIGQKQYVSGQWYYLVARLFGNQYGNNYPTYDKLLEIAGKTYHKMVSSISDASLEYQIYKISNSQKTKIQKLNLLQQIRGYVFYLSNYVQHFMKHQEINERIIKLFQQLMQIKDFWCFQQLIRTYMYLYDKQIVGGNISPKMIKSIQQNCLPDTVTVQDSLKPYHLNQIQFYSCKFEDDNNIQIEACSSIAMRRMLDLVLQTRGCKHKRSICQCCEEYIHSAIEQQYDHQFNPHQFMSACHLMAREISRIIKVEPEQKEKEDLKTYLMNNIKWLLNLNQSCLPQYKRCINFKIFDLMIAFPPLFQKNQFLQAVIQDQLIERIPFTLNHLRYYIACSRQRLSENKFNLDKEESEDITEKLLKKLRQTQLEFKYKVQIWSLIIEIWEKNENKLLELMEIYSLHEDHTLAKYIVLKKKKAKLLEKIEPKTLQILSKMEKYRHFYKDELNMMRIHLKND